MRGSIGRSRLAGHATILKRDGRTKINGAVDFSQLDFDDLADDQGLEKQAALRDSVGPRVLPNTRVNLSQLGPTDGQLRFTVHKLLVRKGSVFRTLSGVLSLDHRVLRITHLASDLQYGRMTGNLTVDHRKGRPKVSLSLSFRDGSLGALLAAPDTVDAPFVARINLAGEGDTLREALSHGNGHAGFFAGPGKVSRVVATILGQDMGKLIGTALDKKPALVGLDCAALGFKAHGGILQARTFYVITDLSRSEGEGVISLPDETIALSIRGAAKKPSGLPLNDPIRIGGTLSAPKLQLGDLDGHRAGVGKIVGTVLKSIATALGLEKDRTLRLEDTPKTGCAALRRRIFAE